MYEAKTISLRLCQGKKVSVFPVTGLKILGTVGTHIIFLEKNLILWILKDKMPLKKCIKYFFFPENLKKF